MFAIPTVRTNSKLVARSAPIVSQSCREQACFGSADRRRKRLNFCPLLVQQRLISHSAPTGSDFSRIPCVSTQETKLRCDAHPRCDLGSDGHSWHWAFRRTNLVHGRHALNFCQPRGAGIFQSHPIPKSRPHARDNLLAARHEV